LSYATIANLKDRIGDTLYAQLTDLEALTTADDTVGQARLDDAHGYINAKLGQRYQTPIDVSVDTDLANTMKAMTCAVAAVDAYRMHPTRSKSLREAVEALAARWIELLDDIANGKAALPGASKLPSPTTSGPDAAVVGERRVFTKDSMKGLP